MQLEVVLGYSRFGISSSCDIATKLMGEFLGRA